MAGRIRPDPHSGHGVGSGGPTRGRVPRRRRRKAGDQRERQRAGLTTGGLEPALAAGRNRPSRAGDVGPRPRVVAAAAGSSARRRVGTARTRHRTGRAAWALRTRSRTDGIRERVRPRGGVGAKSVRRLARLGQTHSSWARLRSRMSHDGLREAHPGRTPGRQTMRCPPVATAQRGPPRGGAWRRRAAGPGTRSGACATARR